VNATIEGVVRCPSELGITIGSLPSITATHEFVVPKSIPIIFAIISLLYSLIISFSTPPPQPCRCRADDRLVNKGCTKCSFRTILLFRSVKSDKPPEGLTFRLSQCQPETPFRTSLSFRSLPAPDPHDDTECNRKPRPLEPGYHNRGFRSYFSFRIRIAASRIVVSSNVTTPPSGPCSI